MSGSRRADLRATTRHLIDSGLLSPSAIHRFGVTARENSRSHPVAVVTVGETGSGFVVKDYSDPAADDSQGSADREIAVYELAARRPELAALLPRWHGRSHEPMLVLELVPDGSSVTDWLRRASLFDDELARMLGSAIAVWHDRTADVESGTTRPFSTWCFAILSDDRPAFLSSNQPANDWLASVPDRPRASDLLSEAATRWRPTAIIHGDVRFDNFVFGTRPGEPTLTIVDWEQAGWGDPAWDLASLVQEYLTHAGVTTLSSPIDRRLRRSLATLARAYCETRGIGRDLDFLDRVAVFTGVKLLHRAVQLAAWERSAQSADADRHRLLALELLGAPSLLAPCIASPVP